MPKGAEATACPGGTPDEWACGKTVIARPGLLPYVLDLDGAGDRHGRIRQPVFNNAPALSPLIHRCAILPEETDEIDANPVFTCTYPRRLRRR